MYLSWVTPTYNREKRIEKTLREVDAYLRSKNFSGGYEILAAYSQSRDRTLEILRRLEREIPNLKILDLENKGKGWAVKQGMLSARGDIRLFSDDDNSVSPEQADEFLPLVCQNQSGENCFDVVIGSIEVPGAAKIEEAQWYRRFMGRMSKYLISFVTGLWGIHDTQRGFKFFSKKAAEIIFPRQTLNRWGFDFEVLLIAKRRGFKIKEVPVSWVNPPDSAVSLKSYFFTLLELFKVKWKDLKGVYK